MANRASRPDTQTAAQQRVLSRLIDNPALKAADEFYTATFTPLNGSGVSGGAVLAFDVETNTLTVIIAAKGVEANQPHIQHIHGFLDGRDAVTPDLSDDADGDGFVELLEGVPDYGGVLLNLTVNHDEGSGGDNGHSHGALEGFPTAPDGTIYYVQSFQLPAGDLPASPELLLRHLVIHGMTVQPGAGAGTTGEVDGSGGYELVLPVAVAEIERSTSVRDLQDFMREIDLREFVRAERAEERQSRRADNDLRFEGDRGQDMRGADADWM